MPDARNIAYRARSEARNYKDQYGMNIPGHVLSNRVAQYIHMHTQYGVYRPFGAAVILANWDELKNYSLYMVEPSGEIYVSSLFWK